MELYLANAIDKAGGVLNFFRSAYIWRFGKDVDLATDVLAYKESHKVPKYVEAYVVNIQRKEVIKS